MATSTSRTISRVPVALLIALEYFDMMEIDPPPSPPSSSDNARIFVLAFFCCKKACGARRDRSRIDLTVHWGKPCKISTITRQNGQMLHLMVMS